MMRRAFVALRPCSQRTFSSDPLSDFDSCVSFAGLAKSVFDLLATPDNRKFLMRSEPQSGKTSLLYYIDKNQAILREEAAIRNKFPSAANWKVVHYVSSNGIADLEAFIRSPAAADPNLVLFIDEAHKYYDSTYSRTIYEAASYLLGQLPPPQRSKQRPRSIFPHTSCPRSLELMMNCSNC